MIKRSLSGVSEAFCGEPASEGRFISPGKIAEPEAFVSENLGRIGLPEALPAGIDVLGNTGRDGVFSGEPAPGGIDTEGKPPDGPVAAPVMTASAQGCPFNISVKSSVWCKAVSIANPPFRG